MKKLPAFTLIEVIVVMVISGIVVSASYFCYSMITRQMNLYRSHTDKTLEAVLLQTVIENDLHTSAFVRNETDYELELSSSDKKIYYVFGSNFILRKLDSVTDTFHIHADGPKMTFEKKTPEELHTLVDELTFGVRMADSTYTICFNKEYAPDVLMNEEAQKLNY